MPTQTLSRTWQNPSVVGDIQTQVHSVTTEGADERVVAVPDATVDLEVKITLDVSEIKLLRMTSDRNMTVKTNSAGVPDNTIALLANSPLLWVPDMYCLNPLTIDVVTIFLSNASGFPATFKLNCLKDPTP